MFLPQIALLKELIPFKPRCCIHFVTTGRISEACYPSAAPNLI